MIVLDASLMAAWLLGEQTYAEATGLGTNLADAPVIVPSHWPIEISNTLRTHLKSGHLSIANFHVIMDRLDLVTIRVEPAIDLDEIGPLAQFSVTHNLTTYDAAYVQLAVQHEATLATLDRAMRAAAMKLNIPLLPA
ncbi:MAG: type II toxin-antitoxin system VapC family toxin [Pseudomonadota bacterium]